MDNKGKKITEISDLIAKHLFETLSEEEALQLEEWLNAAEHHREIFAQLCDKKIDKEYMDPLLESKVDEAFRRFMMERKKQEKKSMRLQLTGMLKYAALFILPVCIAIALWQFYSERSDKMPELTTSSQEYATNRPILTLTDGTRMVVDKHNAALGQIAGIGIAGNDSTKLVYSGELSGKNKLEYHTLSTPSQCDYHFILSDGTKVWVNAKSVVKYPVRFGKDERVIYAEGEIYLEVAKDSLRPFYVVTDEVKVEVLGTSFNVNAYADEPYATVTLVSGKVAARVEAGVYQLVPGEQLAMEHVSKKTDVRKVDVKDVIAWKNGLYLFKGQTLEEVARVLNRWYDVDFVFDNDLVRETKYTGVVKKEESIEAFIRIINEISSFKCYLNGRTLYIK